MDNLCVLVDVFMQVHGFIRTSSAQVFQAPALSVACAKELGRSVYVVYVSRLRRVTFFMFLYLPSLSMWSSVKTTVCYFIHVAIIAV